MRKELILVGVILLTSLDARAQATFVPIGAQLGDVWSGGVAISPDGQFVVGVRPAATGEQGFLWSASGVIDLGTPSASGVSREAGAVAGWQQFSFEYCDWLNTCYPVTSTEGARWTAVSGWVGIGGTPYVNGTIYTLVNDVSSDGVFMVGRDGYSNTAFRWSESGGRIPFPGFQSASYFDASSVSADGTVVSGSFREPYGPNPFKFHGFYRRDGDGLHRIVPIAGYEHGFEVVSPDGNSVVGAAEGLPPLGRAAIKWTEAGGTVLLPNGGWANTHSESASANGAVIVGGVNATTVWEQARAAVWIQGGGPTVLQDLLANTYGVNLGGWTLISAHDVSYDGTTIVGGAIDTLGRGQAYLATIPAVGGPFVCGNGQLAGNEDCDDGNTLAGDGCSASCTLESCANHIDDDGDGSIDLVDAGCADAKDRSEIAIVECSNGIDDDRDGLIDLGDTGCAAAADLAERDPTHPCDDGADNDGDQYVDYPNDPACLFPSFSRESSQCQDGIDNDGAAGIDFDGGASHNGGVALAAVDPECAGVPQRDREIPTPACGLGGEIALVATAIAALRRRYRG